MRIRPYKRCDAEYIADWCSDKDVFEKWGGERFGEFPISADIINDKYLKSNGDCIEPDNFYPMTAVVENVPVGHFIIRYINSDPSILRFGWVIVDKNRRGRGIGKEMLRTALGYAFDIYGAEKVTIGVFEHNHLAYSCYKSVGFTEVPDISTSAEEAERVIELEMTRNAYISGKGA